MIKLYIINTIKNEEWEIPLGEYDDIKECNKTINRLIELFEFKSYYRQVSDSSDGLYIDYGSYSKFFLIKGISFGEYINAIE